MSVLVPDTTIHLSCVNVTATATPEATPSHYCTGGTVLMPTDTQLCLNMSLLIQHACMMHPVPGDIRVSMESMASSTCSLSHFFLTFLTAVGRVLVYDAFYANSHFLLHFSHFTHSHSVYMEVLFFIEYIFTLLCSYNICEWWNGLP